MLRVTAPGPREAWNPLPDVFISNRGLIFPVPVYTPVHLWMLGALVVGIIATIIVKRWAHRRQMATGQQFPRLGTAVGLIVGLPLLAFILGGMPTALDAPALKGFNFAGGKVVSPEFVALLIGLVAYTAAFIAEIVRAGILGVAWGQSEAASALGLRRGLALRLVVLPQALRIIVPPMTSQYLNLTKNSSLAVAIGFPDVTSIGNTTINQTGQAIEGIAHDHGRLSDDQPRHLAVHELVQPLRAAGGTMSQAAEPRLALPGKPPTTSVGAIAWVRANLFNSIPNSLLTLVALFIAAKLIPPFIHWAVIDATWVALDAAGMPQGRRRLLGLHRRMVPLHPLRPLPV